MAAKHRVNSVAMHYMYNSKLKREETLLILYNKRSQYGLFRDNENRTPYCVCKYMTLEEAMLALENYIFKYHYHYAG